MKEKLEQKVLQLQEEIARRKIVEDALTEEKTFIESALNTLQDVFFVFDLDGRFLMWNRAMNSVSGYSNEEVSSMKWSDFFLREDIDRVAEAFERVVREGHASIEATVMNKDRRQIPFEFVGGLLNDHKGNIIGISAVGRDITKRNKTEEELWESQERYRALVDNTMLGIAVMDTNYRIIMVNPTFAKLFKKSAGDFAGKYCFREFEKREAVCQHCPGTRAMVSGKTEEVETQGVRDDGHRFYVHNRAAPFFGSDGMLRGFIEMVEDIDARKQAEDALKASEKKYRTLIENLPQKIFYKDNNSIYVSCNENYARDLKIGSDKITGKTDYDFFPNELAEKYRVDDKRIMESGGTEDIEEKYIQDGREVFVYTVKTPVKDERDNIIGVLGIIWDITKRKQAEEEIRKLNEELEQKVEKRTKQLREAQEELIRKEKLAILGQLAGGVGHELRNPLGVINNAIYFLKTIMPDADETVKEYLNIINDEVLTSERIVSNLLDFARTKTPQKSLVTVGKLITQSLKKCKVPENITVEADIPETLPEVIVDPMQMGQVFKNLITNAVQAMPDEGSLEIRAEEDKEGGALRISITDTGQGISPENMGKLFQPLFTTKARGIGFGLTVSKSLTEANGGRIEVDSHLGKGTTFTVMLPVERETT